LQREVEERTLVFRRQQDELGRARTALAVKRQEARSLRQQLATQQTAAQDLKAQIEQRAARMQEAQAQFSALCAAIDSHQAQLEQAQSRSQALTGELRLAEEKASELDLQILGIEQETLQLRQKLNELEVAYRRCLLDATKLRQELGWRPTVLLKDGVPETVKWEHDHRSGWERVLPKLDINEQAWGPPAAAERSV